MIYITQDPAQVPQFIVGEVVYLKSGSPPLTISQPPHDDIIEVDWFAGDQLRRDGFHKYQLTTAKSR